MPTTFSATNVFWKEKEHCFSLAYAGEYIKVIDLLTQFATGQGWGERQMITTIDLFTDTEAILN